MRSPLSLALVVGLTLLSGACARSNTGTTGQLGGAATASGAADQAALVGVGSTFAAPIVRDWIAQYRLVAPRVAIDYRATSSVGGIRQLQSGAADFAVSEVPLSNDERDGGAGKPAVVQVALVAGAVAVAYNLPPVGTLKLSGKTLAAIFAGKVTTWNDALIRDDNPGVALPLVKITAVHRSEPSGTSRRFTDFLQAAAPGTWPLGSGTTVTWAIGTPAQGSDGMVAAIRERVGSIGYVADNYALTAGLTTASIQNGAGMFVGPTADGVVAAVSGANLEPPRAYPIATIAYLLFPASIRDPAKKAALTHFAAWSLTEGQRSAERLGYARVPLPTATIALAAVERAGSSSADARGAGGS